VLSKVEHCIRGLHGFGEHEKVLCLHDWTDFNTHMQRVTDIEFMSATVE